MSGVCAWCRRRKDEHHEPYGPKLSDQEVASFYSHGICKPCKESMAQARRQGRYLDRNLPGPTPWP